MTSKRPKIPRDQPDPARSKAVEALLLARVQSLLIDSEDPAALSRDVNKHLKQALHAADADAPAIETGPSWPAPASKSQGRRPRAHSAALVSGIALLLGTTPLLLKGARLSAAEPLPGDDVIRRILVRGNLRVEASTVVSYLPIQVGESVTAAQIDLALRALDRTQLFSDVRIELSNGDLTVTVVENQIVNRVLFEGLQLLTETQLRDQVSVRPRGIYSRALVAADVTRILECYRRAGRVTATVTPKVVELPQHRVDIVFTVDEGRTYKFAELSVQVEEARPVAKVAKVEVDSAIPKLDKDLLAALIPIRPGDTYNDEAIVTAVDALTFAAGAAGWVFVEVKPRYRSNVDAGTVDVAFEIREGPRIYVDRIDVVGSGDATREQAIRDAMSVSEGEAYNSALINRSREGIMRLDGVGAVEISEIPGQAPGRTILQVKINMSHPTVQDIGAARSNVDDLVLELGLTETSSRGRMKTTSARISLGALRRDLLAGSEAHPQASLHSGGRTYAIETVELVVPVFLPENYGIKASLFSDAGTLGALSANATRRLDDPATPPLRDDLSLRASAGHSIYWKSPMGPIRFDFGRVLSRESYEEQNERRYGRRRSA